MTFNDRLSVFGYGGDSPQATVARVIGYGPNSTTVQLTDGSVETRYGDRASRNNNPGNLRPASWETQAPYGAVGTEGDPNGKYGQMSVFPSDYEGNRARERLMFDSPTYGPKSLLKAIEIYAPRADMNDPTAYGKKLAAIAGVDPNRKMSSFTEAERRAIMAAQLGVEGNTGFRATRTLPPGALASNFPNPSETVGVAGTPGWGKPGEMGSPPPGAAPQTAGFFSSLAKALTNPSLQGAQRQFTPPGPQPSMGTMSQAGGAPQAGSVPFGPAWAADQPMSQHPVFGQGPSDPLGFGRAAPAGMPTPEQIGAAHGPWGTAFSNISFPSTLQPGSPINGGLGVGMAASGGAHPPASGPAGSFGFGGAFGAGLGANLAASGQLSRPTGSMSGSPGVGLSAGGMVGPMSTASLSPLSARGISPVGPPNMPAGRYDPLSSASMPQAPITPQSPPAAPPSLPSSASSLGAMPSWGAMAAAAAGVPGLGPLAMAAMPAIGAGLASAGFPSISMPSLPSPATAAAAPPQAAPRPPVNPISLPQRPINPAMLAPPTVPPPALQRTLLQHLHQLVPQLPSILSSPMSPARHVLGGLLNGTTSATNTNSLPFGNIGFGGWSQGPNVGFGGMNFGGGWDTGSVNGQTDRSLH